MNNFSIKIKNYKCFKEESGFDSIKRVNLIIGRNNTGKSSLLDIIETSCKKEYQFDSSTWYDKKPPQVIFRSMISENTINYAFQEGVSGGRIGGNHREYGKRFIGRKLVWSKPESSPNKKPELIGCDDSDLPHQLSGLEEQRRRLLDRMPIPIENLIFKKVQAERDIMPEKHEETTAIQPNGVGITNTIQNFINQATLPRELVKIKILNALNEIFAQDANFTEIDCQVNNSLWEIYLEEEHKGHIALSKSGSGLKTVLAVLACLFLDPEIKKRPLNNYIFAFEELENNIHPALLRRLNDYIYKSSVENNFIFFLTTHSSVMIDQFSKQEDAQIIHVTHNGIEAKCTVSRTYIANNGILDDLDVRASDLLQANGIVWVEGPSDRIYLNRWIDIWSKGELKEGTHYQIIFYGGRLLSHLSAQSLDSINDEIAILNANRNAIIVIDSDKKYLRDSINKTKKRIRNEFEKIDAFCWITKGKEIENYISGIVIEDLLGEKVSNPASQFDSFFDRLEKLKKGEGKKYSNQKPLLAETLAPIMTFENMQDMLDLDERLTEICDKIRSWNT